MKKRNLIYVTCMLIAMGVCSSKLQRIRLEGDSDKKWGKYNAAPSWF